MSLRCAFCHADAPEVACPGCQTKLHARCWSDAGRCPTLGCERRPGPTTWWDRLAAWLYGSFAGHAGSPGALANEAILLAARGAAHEARSRAEQALTLDPDHSLALLARSLACQWDDPAQTLADARRLLARSATRDDSPAHRLLVLGLAAAACGQLDDEAGADAAHAELEALARAGPRTGRQLLIRAEARLNHQDLAGALADLEELGALPAHSAAEAVELRARALRQLGQFDEALAYLADAMDDGRLLGVRHMIRCARWKVRATRGDLAAEVELAQLPDVKDPGLLMARGVAAALRGDRGAAHALFAGAAEEPSGRAHAWQWAAALGLGPVAEPAKVSIPWQATLGERIRGELTDDELLRRAWVASGPRSRTVRLHEAHAGLALLAFGRGDTASEVVHLRTAAALGDQGGLLDCWIHSRARRLGVQLEHRPPTLAEATPPPPAVGG